MICRDCFDDPCTCTNKSEKPKRVFVIQECTHPGCTVVIRTEAGKQTHEPVCKWHEQGKAYYHATGHSALRPITQLPVMTKEEFGLDLYEAIRINGARLECELRGKTEQAKAFQDELQTLLPKLDPVDVRRILEMR